MRGSAAPAGRVSGTGCCTFGSSPSARRARRQTAGQRGAGRWAGRGARGRSERHWLLSLRLFSERATGEAANGGPEEAGALAGAGRRGAGELPGIVEIKAIEAGGLGSPRGDPGGIAAPS